MAGEKRRDNSGGYVDSTFTSTIPGSSDSDIDKDSDRYRYRYRYRYRNRNSESLKQKDKDELIRMVKSLSEENGELRTVIKFQREEIRSLTKGSSLNEGSSGSEKAKPVKPVEPVKPAEPAEEGTLLSLLELMEKVPVRENDSKLRQFLTDAFLNKNSKYYTIVNTILVSLVLFSVICVVLESVPSIFEEWKTFFLWSEMIVVGFFTIEYIINIYVAENRLKYIFSFWGLIDLIAIIPTYFYLIDLRDVKMARTLRIVRFLRTIRILRVMKLAKNAGYNYRQSAHHCFNTLKLDLEIYGTTLFNMVTIFSTLVYYAERNVPDTPFTHIPASMWWCLVTITTVGYGDMNPSTVIGKLIAAVAMILGLALFGILMSVIGKAMIVSLVGANKLE